MDVYDEGWRGGRWFNHCKSVTKEAVKELFHQRVLLDRSSKSISNSFRNNEYSTRTRPAVGHKLFGLLRR